MFLNIVVNINTSLLCVSETLRLYFLILNINPKTTPKNAANNT